MNRLLHKRLCTLNVPVYTFTGEKLAKILDKKLKQHREVNGDTGNDPMNSHSNETASSLSKNKRKKSPQSPKLKNSPKKRKKSASLSSSTIAKDPSSALAATDHSLSDTATPKPKVPVVSLYAAYTVVELSIVMF